MTMLTHIIIVSLKASQLSCTIICHYLLVIAGACLDYIHSSSLLSKGLHIQYTTKEGSFSVVLGWCGHAGWFMCRGYCSFHMHYCSSAVYTCPFLLNVHVSNVSSSSGLAKYYMQMFYLL